MSASRRADQGETGKDSYVLEALGLTESEEHAYVTLLQLDGGSVEQLAESSDLSRTEAGKAVRSLEAKGLVTRSARRPQRLLPATPDVALDMLILRRQEELERARLAATSFVERFKRPGGRDAGEVVEVVLGADALRERFIQLQRSAEEEVLGFDRPPYVTAPSLPANPIEVERLGHGVRYRIIYDTSALEVAGQVRAMSDLADLGEEARTLDDVPMKLAIADRKLALVPLTLEEGRGEEALLVYPSALLDSLVMLFQSLWDRALPLSLENAAADPEDAISPDDRRVLALLASGLKDVSIASQLEVSARTIERRVTKLMELLGVRTRFQLGLQSGLRGWIGDRSPD